MNPVKVMIGVPTGEYGRKADFYDYYNMLKRPENTVGSFVHGCSPAQNRNIIIEQAIEHRCTHVMFIDDDMAVPPDMLMRLLEHNKDIVSGLYLHRNYPHFPIMFDRYFPDGRCQYKFLTPEMQGIQEVVNCGFGCVLIKTEVFKKMRPTPDDEPWVTLGQLDKDKWGDDIHFFNKARTLGFKIFVDVDIPVGHMMNAIIIPRKHDDGNWYTLYNTNAPESFQVPQIQLSKEDLDKGLEMNGLSDAPDGKD